MARLSKALRGKRRWIGLEVDESINNRSELEAELEEDFRLYDFIEGKAIIRVPLQKYADARERFNNGKLLSITSSGKIKLVRERLGIKQQ